MKKYEALEKKLSYLYNNFPLVYKKRKQNFAQSLKMSYEQNITNKKINIGIIGLGGTGSWFLPKIVKMANKIALQQSIPVNLLLIDGDTVSESNLLRQNFLAQDVGNFKSTALANRYKHFLHPNVTIYHSNKYYNLNFNFNTQIFEDFFVYTNSDKNNEQKSFLFCFVDKPQIVDTIISHFEYSDFYLGQIFRYLIIGLNEKTDGHVDIIRQDTSSTFYIEHPDFERLTDFERLIEENLEKERQKENKPLETCTTISLEEQTYNANDFVATMAATLFGNIINWEFPDFSTYYFNTNEMIIKSGKTYFSYLHNIISENEDENYEAENLSIFA